MWPNPQSPQSWIWPEASPQKGKNITFFLAFNNYLYIKKLGDPSSIVGSFWNPLKTVSVNVSNFYSRLISTK